jgi:hypothetical protein
MDQMQTIIKREFEAARPGARVDEVEFTANEEIIVKTGNGIFTMEIGSDDNGFYFVNERHDEYVSFPFPPDWDEAIDENNGS